MQTAAIGRGRMLRGQHVSAQPPSMKSIASPHPAKNTESRIISSMDKNIFDLDIDPSWQFMDKGIRDSRKQAI